MTKLHNLSINGAGDYVKRFCMSRECSQGCGTVDKPVEIVQNFVLSTAGRYSLDFFQGNRLHKFVNIRCVKRVFQKLRRLLWKKREEETPRKNWNFSVLCLSKPVISRSAPWRTGGFL